MKRNRYGYSPQRIAGAVLLAAAVLLGACADESLVEDSPRPGENPAVSDRVPEGYARMGLVFRVDTSVKDEAGASAGAGTAATRSAESQRVTEAVSEGGLSVARTAAAWNDGAPVTREGALAVENAINDLWVVQKIGRDKVYGQYTNAIYRAEYITADRMPAMETIEDGDATFYHLSLNLPEAPEGCEIYFFANTGDDDMFAHLNANGGAGSWNDFVVGYNIYTYQSYNYHYRMVDSEAAVTATGIPMYGRAFNPYTSSAENYNYDYTIAVPFPEPSADEPWPAHWPAEWAGSVMATMEYTISKVRVTVDWESTISTALGMKGLNLETIQLQSVPRVALHSPIYYTNNVQFPALSPNSYGVDSYDDLFMDYAPLEITGKETTYTWYLPPNYRGSRYNYNYGTLIAGEHLPPLPPMTAALDPSTAGSGASRASRFVLRGTCGGQPVAFTVYLGYLTESGPTVTGIYTINSRTMYYNVVQGNYSDYTIDITGIDPADSRVEWDGYPSGVSPDGAYIGTWRKPGSTTTNSVIISENKFVCLQQNRSGSNTGGYTFSDAVWTAVTEPYPSAANGAWYNGYRMVGKLTAYTNGGEAIMSTDEMTRITHSSSLNAPVQTIWYVNPADKGRIRRGALIWPHTSESGDYIRSAVEADYYGTWKNSNGETITITKDNITVTGAAGGIGLEKLSWTTCTNWYGSAFGLTPSNSPDYPFGFRLAGTVVKPQSTFPGGVSAPFGEQGISSVITGWPSVINKTHYYYIYIHTDNGVWSPETGGKALSIGTYLRDNAYNYNYGTTASGNTAAANVYVKQ